MMAVTKCIGAAASAALFAVLVTGCGSVQTQTVNAMSAATGGAAAPATTATAPADPPQPDAVPFTFKARTLPASIRRRVKGSSWHKGCPVGLGKLRYIRMGYWGFDRKHHRGSMIVKATVVADVRKAFRRLFDARFPIRKMRLVDDYGASDNASIEADNTSAFNCRRATGSSRWSEHAYGRAIDINPIENPYVYADGTTTHRKSKKYLDRSRYRRGMAVRGRILVRVFDGVGWGWGGRWPSPKDFQHFSSTNR